MKIAFVYDVAYPFVKRGIEKRNFELATELAKRHDVHLYAMNSWGKESEFRQNGYVIHGVCPSQTLYGLDGKRRILPSLYFSLKLLPALWKEDFDIVDCSEFPYFPIFVCKIYSVLRKKKVVFSWHEVWGKYWFKYMGLLGAFGYVVEKLAMACSDPIITVSEKTRRDLVDAGIFPKNITVIENGIDFEELTSAPKTQKSADIVFAGRLVPHKNAHLLVLAMKYVSRIMPEVKCRIIGLGPEERILRELVTENQLSDNVEISGPLELRKDYYSQLKSAKVLVHPSEREGHGITIIEAQAAGLPVITLRHQNNAGMFLVDHRVNGLLCTDDPRDMAEKIVILLQSESLRKNLGETAQQNVKHKSWKNSALLIEKNFEKMRATV